jgi:SAM-dependent methyltransferase
VSATCPSCGAAGMTAFYEMGGAPVHSVLLMRSREEAVGHPRGDIRLAHCSACGFIANTTFDATLHEYSPDCEETQGFSPTFSAFADKLAQRLVSDYDIRGKDVLEIGCGKGEFLHRLCLLGDNRGIGIDPAYLPERSPELKGRLRFIQELYSAKHDHLPADVVCCRHTLEHIAPVADFVRIVREAIGPRMDTLVFFDLPETTRVLREAAFWDVYYEHCSYFTPGSLTRLFRASGFDILELDVDYDGQMILLVARPAPAPTGPALPSESGLAEIATLVTRFEDAAPAHIAGWQLRVRELAASGRVAIWGAGSKAVAFLTTTGLAEEVGVLVDINPHKQGMFMPGTGHPVVAPAALVDYDPDDVIVMNPIYCDEIRRDLDRMGLSPRLHPV